MHRFIYFVSVMALVQLMLAGCALPDNKNADSKPNPEPHTLVIFAAASLSEAMHELAERFESQHPGVTVVIDAKSTSDHRKDLESGAKADLFAFVSKLEMEKSEQSGVIETGRARIYMHNKLSLVVPKDNPARISGLNDLNRPGLRIAMASEEFPIGRYTLECLDKLKATSEFGGAWHGGMLRNIVSRDGNARGVLSKVQKREVDVGFVYASDLLGRDPDAVAGFPIPDAYNVRADYLVAPVKGSKQSGLAEDFMDLMQSKEGRAVFEKRGFITN